MINWENVRVTTWAGREIVTCRICGRRYAGVIPKGGNVSILFPWKHYIKIPVDTDTNEMMKELCFGSALPSKEFTDD